MANARLWSIALLVWLPAAAFADPPPASFAIAFDGDAAVWNPFDGFQACETLEGVTLCLDLDAVVCNGKGACAGDASFEFSGLLDGLLTGPFTAQAKCKATDDPTRPVCKAKIASCETTGTIEGLENRVAPQTGADHALRNSNPARASVSMFGVTKCSVGRGHPTSLPRAFV